MADTSWTLSWNEKAGQFLARFRRFDGSGWGTKRVPKTITRHQKLDAERFMVGWYADYLRTGGLNIEASRVVPAQKNLRLLGPRWLKYRYEDRGTKPNTYKGFKESLNNWILDNDAFEHAPIGDLDMACDFQAEVCLAWMNSLRGEDSTRLVHVLTLKTIFADCIGMGWLDQDMANPFDSYAVKKAVSKLAKARKERVVTHLSEAQVRALFTVPTRKVHDFRRVRYLITVASGLRDHEVQGLAWADLHLDAPVPYVSVERQLDKIGCKPLLRYEDLVKQGLDKDAMWRVPNALVSDPKKKSLRDLPLLPLVVETLRYWRRTGWRLYVGRAPANDDPVFPSGKGNRHSPPGQFCFVESAELLRADLTRVQQPDKFNGIDLDFHALRRTFATLLSSKGVSEGEIGDLLGHAAKSVARGHYIDKLLKRRLELLRLLPLPEWVQLQAKAIEVTAAETHEAEVIRLPMTGAAPSVARTRGNNK